MKKRRKENFSSCLLEVGNIITSLTFSVLYALVFLVIYSPYSDTAWFGMAKSESYLLTTTFVVASVLFLILIVFNATEAGISTVSNLLLLASKFSRPNILSM